MKTFFVTEVPDELSTIVCEYNNVFGVLTSHIEVEIFESKESIISFNRPIDKLRF